MAVQEIRAFNRFYTNLIGALDYSKHLYTPYTLTESRVLYELAHAPRTDAADLRLELSLDAGYLSRLLGKFERDGLVERAPSEEDSRRQRITLTPRGREATALLDERSREAVGRLLADVPAAEQPRLTEAMRTVRDILGEVRPDRRGRSEGPALRDPVPGELGWIVQRHGALYAAEYGWNADFEGLVARIVADFAQDHDPHLERVWIAELDGRPVGSVMCVRDEAPATARLRLLLVEPEARGHRLGERLVGAVVDFAREVGYRELVLWTNGVLTAARRIYQRAGFTLVAEKPHRSYGADLVGQDWRLSLQEGSPK
ncbi:helix-turn-helix domain-containing GNAT family N-acetyltransferase [Streptomyces sp. HNM0645]|uniref:bifunctional helix-turn-helix transcriptional regulator/GNAT family N-acetyltransferase n=1 Tax=Streptomyces sp. HNM0645 TaxID=2782343 RepID=UPI0024B77069|nr:helix-turn-helix domain-containing GNAT family N-acetyltransferase [Streptomyces sp. HNM0645]MDI9884587.1 helix-turn-helix domain-containing GNAT family N-acetyltransferase [Streptomyces sp. HNM0645]